MENQHIRVRIIITRLDPVRERLWHLVRQDLAQQLTQYFHYRPELEQDRDQTTLIHVPVTPTVAQVGLHAPAFAQAVRKMLDEYGLPQRFAVALAILRSRETLTHEHMRQLKRSNERIPDFDWLEVIETAEVP